MQLSKSKMHAYGCLSTRPEMDDTGWKDFIENVT